MPGLRELDLDIHYESSGGSILASLVQPAVAASVRYDRLTGYFTVSSLLAISEGIESLWRRGGRMRLVLGAHDVPPELLEAAVGDDWPKRLVDALRDRLIRGVSSLTDEFAKDRVATIAWMMRDGLLTVRVAAPSRPDATGPSIFHNKRLIFTDDVGDTVSAVGSPNETFGGLVANFEELTVHMSWQDPMGYVRTHQESFERIWAGLRDDLVVSELDESFANDLLQAATRPTVPPAKVSQSSYLALLEVARKLPSLAFVNLSAAALFPHQERAVVDALDRWPIRVLLADEVGLGKTLEAGAILASLLRTRTIRRVVILAPKNVTRQWRDEMLLHFGLDFWIYDSAAKLFESAHGSVRRVPAHDHPLGHASPDLLIVSSQLARGSSRTEDLLSGAEPPDLLLVDEAHAARVRTDLDGTRRPTLLWKMLDRHRTSIPHMLFLTATPMQLEWVEYFALLELLGLPPDWDEATYERSLRLLASPSSPSLDQAGEAVALIASANRGYRVSDATSLPGLEGTSEPSTLAQALAALRSWDSVFEALVASHPANVLTVRNSRDALERLGYSFPTRTFTAPALAVPDQVRRFYEGVSIYLRDAYGITEQAASPDRSVQLGFVKSTYFQRLASSLEAARRTLRRREAKLETATERLGMPEPGEPDDEFDSEVPAPDPIPAVQGAVRQAAAVERVFVRDLLAQLEHIEADGVDDPKISRLMGEILSWTRRGDRVLVFSRYTDTVDACLAAFLASVAAEFVGHAMYTGGASWVDTGGGPVSATKEGVRRALDLGLVSVVFCSDAASEGLNLQAARVLINVDVPWNPARLEQRIGRVARLGQRAESVDIVNLWYPDSVEARMYGRLLERRDLYELAVGSLPDIFSDAIRQEVSASIDASWGLQGVDPLQRLQALREDIQLRAISRVWDHGDSIPSKSSAYRAQLLAVILASLERSGTVATPVDDGYMAALGSQYHVLQQSPGAANPVSLRNAVWDELDPVGIEGGQDEVVAVEIDGLPVAIGLRRGRRHVLMSDSQVIDVLGTYLGAGPFSLPGNVEWLDADELIAAALASNSQAGPAMPGTGRWRIPTELDAVRPSHDAPRIRVIGAITAADYVAL